MGQHAKQDRTRNGTWQPDKHRDRTAGQEMGQDSRTRNGTGQQDKKWDSTPNRNRQEMGHGRTRTGTGHEMGQDKKWDKNRTVKKNIKKNPGRTSALTLAVVGNWPPPPGMCWPASRDLKPQGWALTLQTYNTGCQPPKHFQPIRASQTWLPTTQALSANQSISNLAANHPSTFSQSQYLKPGCQALSANHSISNLAANHTSTFSRSHHLKQLYRKPKELLSHATHPQAKSQ